MKTAGFSAFFFLKQIPQLYSSLPKKIPSPQNRH